MDAYVVVGGASARKSSVIRGLTGAGRRGVRQVSRADGTIISVYVRISSLQEEPISPNDFVAEIARIRCDAILFAMWPNANPKDPIRFPDANAYFSVFGLAGWNIVRVAALALPVGNYPNCQSFPDSRNVPSNQTTVDVRRFFGWR